MLFCFPVYGLEGQEGAGLSVWIPIAERELCNMTTTFFF